MAAQDDKREALMRRVFELREKPGRKRHESPDAYLHLADLPEPVPFELKSTTSTSISTVRDLGPAHIEKWRDLHWLFSFFDDAGEEIVHSYYATPDDMRRWIESKVEYVRPDLALADVLPPRVTENDLRRIFGRKPRYTLEEARRLHKMQWTADQYRRAMDLPDGYSPLRMLEILQARARYVLERGATLNNPHINQSDMERFARIDEDRSHRLKVLVRTYFRHSRG